MKIFYDNNAKKYFQIYSNSSISPQCFSIFADLIYFLIGESIVYFKLHSAIIADTIIAFSCKYYYFIFFRSFVSHNSNKNKFHKINEIEYSKIKKI